MGTTVWLDVRSTRAIAAFYVLWLVDLLIMGLLMVVAARIIYQPTHTQETPEGYLNWYSPRNPPVFVAWAYGLWAVVIGAPFLLWWRPFWQGLAIVAWGWVWAMLSFLFTDSAASHGCFFVTFYAAFVLVYSFLVPDQPASAPLDMANADQSVR